jgi:hypothetical protein
MENKNDIQYNKKNKTYYGITVTIALTLFFSIFYIYYINEITFIITSIVILILYEVLLIISYKVSIRRSITRVRIVEDGIEFSSEKEIKKVIWDDYGKDLKNPYELLLYKIVNHRGQNRIDKPITKKIRKSYDDYYLKKIET